MSDDLTLDAIRRRSRRRRRLGAHARCEHCGEARPEALSALGGRILCQECRTGGPAAVELDHPAGQKHVPDFRIPLHANAHREVTELRRLLGSDDWPDDAGDPLRRAARILTAIASLVQIAATWLRGLADWLDSRYGRDWHEGAPLAPFPS